MSRVITTAEILGDPNPERFLPELDALDHRTARVTVGGVELMVVWAYRSGPRISGRFLAEEIRRQLTARRRALRQEGSPRGRTAGRPQGGVMSVDERKLRAWLLNEVEGLKLAADHGDIPTDLANGAADLAEHVIDVFCPLPVSLETGDGGKRAAYDEKRARYDERRAKYDGPETGDGAASKEAVGPGTVIVDGKPVQAESAEGARALETSAAGGPGHGPAETGDGGAATGVRECGGCEGWGVIPVDAPPPWDRVKCPDCDGRGTETGDGASPAPEGDTEEQEPAAVHAQRGASTSDYKPRAVPNGSTVVQRAVNQAFKGVGSPRRINSHIAADAVHAMEAMGWRLSQAEPGDTEEPGPQPWSAFEIPDLTEEERRAFLDAIFEPGDTETVTQEQQRAEDERTIRNAPIVFSDVRTMRGIGLGSRGGVPHEVSFMLDDGTRARIRADRLVIEVDRPASSTEGGDDAR